jgi:hypothetical protein
MATSTASIMRREHTPPTSTNEAMPSYLFIVSRHTPYLADYMREQFASEPEVQVIVDRRRGERRLTVTVVETERRARERRLRHDVDKELRESFHALVTLA